MIKHKPFLKLSNLLLLKRHNFKFVIDNNQNLRIFTNKTSKLIEDIKPRIIISKLKIILKK